MPLSLTVSRCAKLVVSRHKLKESASTEEVTIICVDLAKTCSNCRARRLTGRWCFARGFCGYSLHGSTPVTTEAVETSNFH